MKIRFIAMLFLLAAQIEAQNQKELRLKISDITAGKNAVIGVAAAGYDGSDTITVNGNRMFVMQSVFKFPVALTVLNRADSGLLSLSDEYRLTPKDLSADTYSPIKEQYPNGVGLSLAELIQYSVSKSDNIATDLLIGLTGGPQSIEKYIRSAGISDITIRYDEAEMQSNPQNQYSNRISPAATLLLLKTFYENKNRLLTNSSHKFIWTVMKATTTGQNSIRGLLPPETVVAHKTGQSGRNPDGMMAALNDIGIVFLPNGRYFYLAVFVGDSFESTETNQRIISEISKAVYDYFAARYSN